MIFVFIVFNANQARAATPTGDISEAGTQKKTPRKSGTNILDVQKALSEMGLYFGPINGYLNADTKAAIRAYQQGAGLKIDGKINRQLIDSIYNATQIRDLLIRLDATKRAHTEAARRKLLDHPATRDLLEKSSSGPERADPTRDPTQCFNTPTTRCLLHEASESAKAVFKNELRNWALGEILAAQARVGLSKDALNTVRRIDDPRLIMVALHDIARAQAQSGRNEDALKAAEIIPDVLKRAEALSSIANIQLKAGDKRAAEITAHSLVSILPQLKNKGRQIYFKSRTAVILNKAGSTEAANIQFEQARSDAQARTNKELKSQSLRHVASALAEMNRPHEALGVIADILSPSDRMPVLVSAAASQARSGDAAAALATAQSIEAVRYRAVVIGQIAQSQAEQGNLSGAGDTLEIASAAIEKIELPYARSYAINRITDAMIKIAGHSFRAAPETPGAEPFKQAIDMAQRIDDNRLRAHSLWQIVAEQRRSGDDSGYKSTTALARTATDQIISRLSRVWMFSEIAINHAYRGEAKAGWEAFANGLEIARNIDNAWGRSRALAKLSTGLFELATRAPE